MAAILLLATACTPRPAQSQSSSPSIGSQPPATRSAPPSSGPGPSVTATITASSASGGSAGPSGSVPPTPGDPTGTSTADPEPTHVTAFFDSIDDTVTLAGPRPKVVIDLYTDPMCPDCARLQDADGPRMLAAVDADLLAIRFHFMTIQDPQSSSGDYSTRAVGALLCAAAYAPLGSSTFLTMYQEIFSPAFQPVQHAAYDHRQSDLVDVAERAGATERVMVCVRGHEAEGLAAQSQASAAEAFAGVDGAGLPTVVAAGRRVSLSQDWLTAVFLGVNK